MAYEMRISDWSSDVCSSDLGPRDRGLPQVIHLHVTLYELRQADGTLIYMAPVPPCFHPNTGIHEALAAELVADLPQIGGASCRERVCQYVYISVVAG